MTLGTTRKKDENMNDDSKQKKIYLVESTPIMNVSLNEPFSVSSFLINRILFTLLICIAISSVFINLFALYRLNCTKKSSVLTFRLIL